MFYLGMRVVQRFDNKPFFLDLDCTLWMKQSYNLITGPPPTSSNILYFILDLKVLFLF